MIFPNTFYRKSGMFSPNMDSPKKRPKRFRKKAVRKSGPPQRKLGRPTKLDQIDTDKLIAEIARGVPVSIACAAAARPRQTGHGEPD
jgi:hypothetical protein